MAIALTLPGWPERREATGSAKKSVGGPAVARTVPVTR